MGFLNKEKPLKEGTAIDYGSLQDLKPDEAGIGSLRQIEVTVSSGKTEKIIVRDDNKQLFYGKLRK